MGFQFIGQYERLLGESIGKLAESAIGKASREVSAGGVTAAMNRWFGDSTPAFRKKLAKDLNNLRANLNVRTIKVGFMSLSNRDDGTNAAAFTNPKWGLKLGKQINYTNNDYGKSEMFLDEAFKGLPILLPLNGGLIANDGYNQSRFNTLVHELSHLILGTEDQMWNGKEAYGAKRASRLAANEPDTAYENAENWGIFVEAVHRNIS